MDKETLALLCKRKEIEALGHAREGDIPGGYDYFSGKAQAFSEVWEYLVFDGRSVGKKSVDPEKYNEMNDLWSEKVAKADMEIDIIKRPQEPKVRAGNFDE